MDIAYKRLFRGFKLSETLKSSLARLDNKVWLEHVNQNCYQGNWHVYPLRGLSKYIHSSPILQAFALEESLSERDYTYYPSSEQFPELIQFLERFQCPILSARLMRLAPQSHILPHRDLGVSLTHGQARIHLCLTSDEGVEFTVDGQSVEIQQGECWYINADKTHSVEHRGYTQRIHLVIDCLASSFEEIQPDIPTGGDLCAAH